MKRCKSMSIKKGGLFTEPVFFPIPSPFDVDQNTPLVIQLKKKMFMHIHQFLIKEFGRGKMKEKLYCSSQHVVKPNWFFRECILGLSEQGSGVKQQVPFLTDTFCLLQEHITIISSSSISNSVHMSVSLTGCLSKGNLNLVIHNRLSLVY